MADWTHIIFEVPGAVPEGGYRQYRVQLKDDLFYLWSTRMEVTSSGDLVAWQDDCAQYAFGAGTWLFFLPVSCLDGTELCVGWWSRWLSQ